MTIRRDTQLKGARKMDCLTQIGLVLVCCLAIVPVTAIETNCTVRTMRWKSGQLICQFSTNIERQHNFLVRRESLDGTGTGEDVVQCWNQKTQGLYCNVRPGYKFDKKVWNMLIIDIPKLSKRHEGKYVCQVIGDGDSKDNPCFYKYTAETSKTTGNFAPHLVVNESNTFFCLTGWSLNQSITTRSPDDLSEDGRRKQVRQSTTTQPLDLSGAPRQTGGSRVVSSSTTPTITSNVRNPEQKDKEAVCVDYITAVLTILSLVLVAVLVSLAVCVLYLWKHRGVSTNGRNVNPARKEDDFIQTTPERNDTQLEQRLSNIEQKITVISESVYQMTTDTTATVITYLQTISAKLDKIESQAMEECPSGDKDDTSDMAEATQPLLR